MPINSKLKATARPSQLEALTSPLRQEIVDALMAMGEASIAELSEGLGRPADSLYFHIRKLETAQVIAAVEQRGTRGRSKWVYRSLLRDGCVRLDLDTAKATQHVIRTVATFLRLTERCFRNSIHLQLARLSGRRRNVSAGRYKGWLSVQEADEVQRLIGEIRSIIQPTTPKPRSRRGSLFSFTAVLCPLPSKPHSRISHSSGKESP